MPSSRKQNHKDWGISPLYKNSWNQSSITSIIMPLYSFSWFLFFSGGHLHIPAIFPRTNKASRAAMQWKIALVDFTPIWQKLCNTRLEKYLGSISNFLSRVCRWSDIEQCTTSCLIWTLVVATNCGSLGWQRSLGRKVLHRVIWSGHGI